MIESSLTNLWKWWPNMKFKFSGNDPIFNSKEFKTRLREEAKLAANGPISRKGIDGKIQSFDEKLKNVETSHKAEWYLIKKHEFKDDTEICHDVFSPHGNPVEIKVSAGAPHTENGKKWRAQQIEKANRQRNSGKINADLLYLFGHNQYAEGHPYTFEATYVFNIRKRVFEFRTTEVLI